MVAGGVVGLVGGTWYVICFGDVLRRFQVGLSWDLSVSVVEGVLG